MNRWQLLRADVEKERDNQQKYSATKLTAVIQRLVGEKRCSGQAPSWIQTKNRVIQWKRAPEESKDDKQRYADALDNRGHPALLLRDIAYLEGALREPLPEDSPLAHLARGPVLSMTVTLNKHDRVRAFGIGIEGLRRAALGHPPCARWYARVELTEEPEGQGDCGHPLLHCHVGDDPEALLSPRTPAPWLLPHEALEWLLATVDPALEPA